MKTIKINVTELEEEIKEILQERIHLNSSQSLVVRLFESGNTKIYEEDRNQGILSGYDYIEIYESSTYYNINDSFRDYFWDVDATWNRLLDIIPEILESSKVTEDEKKSLKKQVEIYGDDDLDLLELDDYVEKNFEEFYKIVYEDYEYEFKGMIRDIIDIDFDTKEIKNFCKRNNLNLELIYK